MKKYLAVIITLLITCSLYAQDTIFTYANGNIICKITEVSSNAVKYKYPNEDIVNSLVYSEFSKIKLKSGRVINGKQRVLIEGEEDWEKVAVTSNPDDVQGLEKTMEISETSVRSTEDGLIGLKRKAARIGCNAVLVTMNSMRTGSSVAIANVAFHSNQDFIKGTAYKYPGYFIHKQMPCNDNLTVNINYDHAVIWGYDGMSILSYMEKYGKEYCDEDDEDELNRLNYDISIWKDKTAALCELRNSFVDNYNEQMQQSPIGVSKMILEPSEIIANINVVSVKRDGSTSAKVVLLDKKTGEEIVSFNIEEDGDSSELFHEALREVMYKFGEDVAKKIIKYKG
jgi:hypothetical protein